MGCCTSREPWTFFCAGPALRSPNRRKRTAPGSRPGVHIIINDWLRLCNVSGPFGWIPGGKPTKNTRFDRPPLIWRICSWFAGTIRQMPWGMKMYFFFVEMLTMPVNKTGPFTITCRYSRQICEAFSRTFSVDIGVSMLWSEMSLVSDKWSE